MYIAPNSVIRVLKDCPLDNTYDHSIYFGSRNAQTDYFIGLTKYIFTEQTYQRVKRGYMRVGRKAEDLYDCNYIMFQNTSFGNKWFYAFITSVEYVNNEVSEIQFEIDPLQTYWFDFELEECFVEREHSVTDGIGDNLVKEDIGYGDYTYGEEQKSGVFSEWKIVLAYSVKANGQTLVPGKMYGGNKVFGQTAYFVATADETGAGAIYDYLQEADLLNNPGSVDAIFMLPTAFVKSFTKNEIPIVDANSVPKYQTSINGYTPRNKKLLCYPYNFMRVDNQQGETLDLHYEYFHNPHCQFRIVADVSTTPTFTLIPYSYNNLNGEKNPHETITLSNAPQCGYTRSDLQSKSLQSLIGLGIGALSVAPFVGSVGAAAIAGSSILSDVIKQNLQAQFSQNMTIKNSKATGMYFDGEFDFRFVHMSIRSEFAKILDDYFDRFGYSTLRLKVPNISSRPHWNYTKTAGCTIKGSMPADDERKICDIFDNGITFWKNGDEVGNYSLNNAP